MPRRLSFRSMLAALAMAAAALCGGVKAQASVKGASPAVEIRSGAATRGEARRGCASLVAALPSEAIGHRDEAQPLDRSGPGGDTDIAVAAPPASPVVVRLGARDPFETIDAAGYPQALPRAPPSATFIAPTA